MNQKTKLVISITINIILSIAGLYFLCKRINFQQHLPANRSDSTFFMYNRARSEIFDSLPINKGDIVFFGNSITESFPVTEYFPSLPIRNRGIGGNQIIQLIQRLPPILSRNPTKIFIEIGINDVLQDVPYDTITHRFGVMLDLLHRSNANIFITSILPIGLLQDLRKNDTINRLNFFLRQITRMLDMHYINIAPALKLNGVLNPAYTYDGIHLNEGGYRVYREKIALYLQLNKVSSRN